MPIASGITQQHQTAASSGDTRQTANRFKAIVFVLLTLLLWFVFALLSQAIVTAVPRVGECMRERGVFRCATLAVSARGMSPASGTQVPASQANGENRPNRGVDVAVLIISLLAALWAASRAVYPPEDFDALDATS